MQSKKPALGKGLSALLPPRQPSSAPEHIIAAATGPHAEPPPEKDRVLELAIDAITPNPFQPRQQFDETALDELAASIRAHGLLQPVLVTRRQNQWVLVAGERRWRAAQRVGLSTIPAIAVEISEREALEIALVENLQREDLNPIDEARAYRVLIERFGLTQDEVATRVEKSRPAVANALRLLNLPPDIQADVEAGRLSAGHARALLALPTARDQRQWRDLTLKRGLSVRELESLIQKQQARPPKARQRTGKPASATDGAVDDLRQRFEEALACKVHIAMSGPDRGKVEIYFTSLDELDRIKEALGIQE
jgi:ParB family chromosome partitioning protein